MATMIIHAGNFKTGSTSIQHFFFHNETNFRYPKINNKKSFYHCQLTLEYIRNSPSDWDKNKVIKKYINYINSSEQNVLISAENLVRLKSYKNGKKALSHLIENTHKFNHKIVFYYREPLSFLKSWYNQQNKQALNGNSTRNFLTFFKNIEESFLSQYDVYEFFIDILGSENVVPLEFGDKKGDEHLNFFIKTINANKKAENYLHVNSGIPKNKIELVRLSKFNGDITRATFSDFDLTTTIKKISRINNLYEKFGKSNLSLYSLLISHWELTSQLSPLFIEDEEIYRKASHYYEDIDKKKSQHLNEIAVQLSEVEKY